MALALAIFPSAQAQVGTISLAKFDTTADFDTGTKSQSINNTEIDTLGDNLGVPTGEFQLGNKLGDRFNTPDTDGRTWKIHWSDAAACNTSASSSISNGVWTWTNTYSGAQNQAQARSINARIGGDLDVQVKFKELSISKNAIFNFALLTEDNNPVAVLCGDFVGDTGVTGAFIQWEDAATGASEVESYRLKAFTVSSFTKTQCGNTTTLDLGTITMRMVRRADLWTFYYAALGAGPYIQFAGPCQQTSGRVYAIFNLWSLTTSLGSSTLELDDYVVVQGEVHEVFNPGPHQPGYRPQGNWTSPEFGSVNHALQDIQLEYWTYPECFITNVTVRWTSNSTIAYTNETDIISGNVTVFNDTTAYTGPFNITVRLEGDYTCSPRIMLVQVTLLQVSVVISQTPTHIANAIIFAILAGGLLSGAWVIRKAKEKLTG